MAETVTLQKVFHEIREIKKTMVSKEEIENLLETWEILHDPETVRQLRAAEQDIKAGRTRPVRNVKDILAHLEE